MLWTLGVAALAAQVAQAQLNFEIYGRLDVALDYPGSRVDSNDRTANPEEFRLTTGSRNRVGIRSLWELENAWRVRGELEQSLLGLNGERLFVDAQWSKVRPFDALAVLAISHYAYGRLDIGRRTDVAKDVPIAIHPWGGDTVASDQCASILSWPCPHELDRPTGVAFETPVYSDRLTIASQVTSVNGSAAISGHAVYAQGVQRVDVGMRWVDSGNWIVPVGIIQPLGSWRVHALWTTGVRRLSASDPALHGNYAFIGATHPWRGGEFRLGVGRYRIDPTRDHSHWGAGYHYPLRRDVIVYADVAAHRGREGTNGGQADFGIKVSY